MYVGISFSSSANVYFTSCVIVHCQSKLLLFLCSYEHRTSIENVGYTVVPLSRKHSHNQGLGKCLVSIL